MAEINTDQHYPNVVLEILDAQERPAKVDGVPVWASSDETVLTVTPTADGMGAAIEPVAPGTARVTVTADADLGEGVKEITGVTDDIVVTEGPSHEASSFKITLGEPADKA
jgi:hypothetical protein